jgi:hypothetical protein
MPKDRSVNSDPQATALCSPSEIVLAMRGKLPERAWLNVDAMLYERNKCRDQNCRVCRQWHNPATGTCGCEPL